MGSLDEKSRIPLSWFFIGVGAAFTILTFIVTITLHVAAIENTANAALSQANYDQEMRKKLWDELKKFEIMQSETNQRLSRIEGVLEHAR